MLHGAVWKMTRVYEGLGIAFPEYRKYEAGAVAGHALICPPNVNGSAMLRKIRNRRVAMLSGWAMNPGAKFRYQTDAAFPLSDHAGYDDLLRHVEAVGPKRVLTLHGYAREFAADLRERGVEAWALTGDNQLELGIARVATVRFERKETKETKDKKRTEGFGLFAGICEGIGGTTGRLEKVRILREYFGGLGDGELRVVAVWLTGHAFSQVANRAVRVGWAVIRRAVLAVSGLSPGDFSAISRRWNDIGLTTAEALVGRGLGPGGTGPSILEVGEFFRKLEEARGPVGKGGLLEEMLGRISAGEAKVLVTILTGELRIGLKEGLVEEAVAEAFGAEGAAVREANMLLGDLGETAVRARAGTLESVELRPFRPMKAMLASPEPDAAGVWGRLGGGGSVWLEDKLDGIRAQVHVAGGECRIFSRELKEVTATFPEIAAAAVGTGREFVLDGEMLAYQDGRPLGFPELQRRLGRKERDLFMANEVPVSFLAFDVLWAEGRSVFRETLAKRRGVLEGLELAGLLSAVPLVSAGSAEEVDAAFDAARARGNEGLIAKDPASAYSPGRRGLAWIKLKKAFATLDCVIVAAEYGHGKRVGVLSDYTFAVRDSRGGLANIGKAYSGLTDVEIADLTEELLGLVVRQRGRVYEVEPRIVLEIAFDSINESDRHASGLAMRFPRIKGIRRDKGVDGIDSVASARRLVARG
jgi:DNA ligase-1